MARLTVLALEILMSPDPHVAIQRAALLPPIHKEMWEAYGNSLPSLESLRWRLVGQRGFTESGFEEFLREYRETIAFAKLDESTPLPIEDESEDDDESTDDEYSQGAVPARMPDPRANSKTSRPDRREEPRQMMHGMRMPFRLAGGDVVYLEGHFPITEAAFDNLIQILNVMRPGLVQNDQDAD